MLTVVETPSFRRLWPDYWTEDERGEFFANCFSTRSPEKPSVLSMIAGERVRAPAERAEIKRALKGMCHETTLHNACKEFFSWIGRPELSAPTEGSRLGYAEILPLIHLKR